MRLYALERGTLDRLLSDRRELLAVARTLHTADAMRAARADLMASARILLSPRKPEDYDKLYTIDAEGAAHIPIVGELTPSAQTDACGAYTAEALTEYGYISAALAKAENDEPVKSIALDINSPGGYIDGLDMAAQAIAASSKPVVAYVGGMAASAAYWLASQADHIVALSPASRVGSIGVALEEYDDDEANARDGIAHRVYTSTDAPDKRPDTKTPEGRAKIVGELDALHAVFVRRVAEGRHVAEAKVSKDFGRGGVLTAEAAMAAGMIDEVRGSHLSRPVSPAGVASSAAATPAAISAKEVRMDLNQLKAEHPDLAKEIDEREATARADGIAAERKRREALLKFKGRSEAVDAAVEKAIAEGKTYDEALPEITASAIFSLPGENAPELASAEPKVDADPDFARTAALAGLSAEDLDKYGPKARKE